MSEELPLPLGDIDEPLYGSGQPYTIFPNDRRGHMAVWGASGSGKTTLLRNMIWWDIHHNPDLGLCVIDPHGDLIDAIADSIPRYRTNDVIYFDPLDTTHAMAINLFERVPKDQQPFIVSSFITILKTKWRDVGWGARMENLLRAGAYVLMEAPQPMSLAAFPLLITNAAYRASLLKHTTNPEVLRFFHQEFDQWRVGTPGSRCPREQQDQ